VVEVWTRQDTKIKGRRGGKSYDVTPVYYRVQKAIQENIENGTWKPYEIIPTEAEIAKIHKVSIGTVKKGILNLINEGYLYRVQGKGTFVAGTSLAREQLRYHHFFKNFESEEAKFQMRFLSLKTSKCPKPLHRFLKIEVQGRVYKLERLCLSDNQPMIHIISYLPMEIFPKFEKLSEKHFERIPLYALIEEKYGLPTMSNHELICAIQADANLAGVLNVTEGKPLLRIEMISYTYRETPYEYRKSSCVTGQWKLFRVI